MSLPYKEGTWFAIPLEKNTFVVGRITRHAPKGRIVLGYLFPQKFKNVPELAEIERFEPVEALRVWRIGDLGLIEGNWPIIGDSANWQRERWPVPDFMRKRDNGAVAWRVTYSDNNPNQVVTEERISSKIQNLERDAIYGYVAAEIELLELLS